MEARHEPKPLLVTVPEACRLIGAGRTTLYALVGEGRLVAKKLGARTLIDVASIESLADSLPRVGSGGR